jgi:hypothetical protein
VGSQHVLPQELEWKCLKNHNSFLDWSLSSSVCAEHFSRVPLGSVGAVGYCCGWGAGKGWCKAGPGFWPWASGLSSSAKAAPTPSHFLGCGAGAQMVPVSCCYRGLWRKLPETVSPGWAMGLPQEVCLGAFGPQWKSTASDKPRSHPSFCPQQWAPGPGCPQAVGLARLSHT